MKHLEINNNEEKPFLYILVGLPGSGKSTYIKNVLSKKLINYRIISSDDILERIASEQNKKYSEIFNDYIGFATKESNEIFAEALSNNRSIIIDKTNMSIKTRKKWLQACGKKYHKISVIFDTDDKTIRERLINREKETGKIISPEILKDFGKRYQEPILVEGFDEILRVK